MAQTSHIRRGWDQGAAAESNRMEVAIFEAFKAIDNRVKAMTGMDVDGQP